MDRPMLFYSIRWAKDRWYHYHRRYQDKTTNRIVAVCLAGRGKDYVNDYIEIADLCVLPQFRGIGLAKYMIGKVVTESNDIASFIKLFVYVGNTAELIYRQMGFMPGPRFTNMSRRMIRA